MSENKVNVEVDVLNVDDMSICDSLKSDSVPDGDKLSRQGNLDDFHNQLEKKEVVPYNVLRECLRLNHYERKVPRLNGAKEFPVIPELEDERFSNFSDHHESSSNLSDLDDEISSNNDKYSDGNNSSTQTPPEIWEVDTDDYYDPNVEIGNRTDLEGVQTEEDMTGQTSHEVRTHPHYFIPFRTASPSFPPNQLDPPTDGQFDDLPVDGQFDD